MGIFLLGVSGALAGWVSYRLARKKGVVPVSEAQRRFLEGFDQITKDLHQQVLEPFKEASALGAKEMRGDLDPAVAKRAAQLIDSRTAYLPERLRALGARFAALSADGPPLRGAAGGVSQVLVDLSQANSKFLEALGREVAAYHELAALIAQRGFEDQDAFRRLVPQVQASAQDRKRYLQEVAGLRSKYPRT